MNTYSIYPIIVLVIIWALYVWAYIYPKYGIRPSISESWYELPGRDRILFTLFCWTLGITLMWYVDHLQHGWFIVSGLAICITGVMGAYKEPIEGTIHIVGSWGSALFALAGIGVVYHNWIPAIGALSTVIIIRASKSTNAVWWDEHVGFGWTVIGLIQAWITAHPF